MLLQPLIQTVDAESRLTTWFFVPSAVVGVSVSPEIHVWKPAPQVMVSGDGAFGR